MGLSDRQAKAYMEEAEISLDSAIAVFDDSVRNDRRSWANVVKICYDAMEQAVSAAIAAKGEVIPKEHPAKVELFAGLYRLGDGSAVVKALFKWLPKRSSAQYVDIRGGEVLVPHERFSEEDAEGMIADCRSVISRIKGMLGQ